MRSLTIERLTFLWVEHEKKLYQYKVVSTHGAQNTAPTFGVWNSKTFDRIGAEMMAGLHYTNASIYFPPIDAACTYKVPAVARGKGGGPASYPI